jgi:hypothetical protein
MPPVAAGDWRVWEKDRKRVAQEIVEGRPFQVWDTERGRFDAMFDFLLRSGLWDAAIGMRPSQLKKDNGIRYSLLNGVECLREMAGIDVPANCGPLLKDPYLLERIGFTAERIQNCLAKDRTVVDTEDTVEPSQPFHRKGSGGRLSRTRAGDPPQALVTGRSVCRGWPRHRDPVRASL